MQDQYRQDIESHRFVFCPPGNGLDTYRVVILAPSPPLSHAHTRTHTSMRRGQPRDEESRKCCQQFYKLPMHAHGVSFTDFHARQRNRKSMRYPPATNSDIHARQRNRLCGTPPHRYSRSPTQSQIYVVPPRDQLLVMLKDVSPRVQYEVLQSGAIPVVLSINDALDGMYKSHLPILMVQTLEGFNKHLLGAPAFPLPIFTAPHSCS